MAHYRHSAQRVKRFVSVTDAGSKAYFSPQNFKLRHDPP